MSCIGSCFMCTDILYLEYTYCWTTGVSPYCLYLKATKTQVLIPVVPSYLKPFNNEFNFNGKTSYLYMMTFPCILTFKVLG